MSLVAVAFVASAVSSQATLYNDLNTYGLAGYGVSTSTPLNDTFDLGTFASQDEEAVWGVATFTIADWNLFDKQETYTIDLDGGNFANGSFQFGLILAGGVLDANVLLTLNQQHGGTLDYQVSAKTGNFRVIAADLLVCTEIPSVQGGNSVPDGGMTLVLLGGSVLGVYALRRRL